MMPMLIIKDEWRDLELRANQVKERLDAWTREIVQWHFDPSACCPFWVNWAAEAVGDPRKEINYYADLDKFRNFHDEWLRGGPVRRVPKAYANSPISTFETGGSTFRTKEPFVGMSLANSRLIDRLDHEESWNSLQGFRAELSGLTRSMDMRVPDGYGAVGEHAVSVFPQEFTLGTVQGMESLLDFRHRDKDSAGDEAGSRGTGVALPGNQGVRHSMDADRGHLAIDDGGGYDACRPSLARSPTIA